MCTVTMKCESDVQPGENAIRYQIKSIFVYLMFKRTKGFNSLLHLALASKLLIKKTESKLNICFHCQSKTEIWKLVSEFYGFKANSVYIRIKLKRIILLY